MEEKPKGDRWAAARSALKKQVGTAVQGVAVGGGRVGGPTGGETTGKAGGEAPKEAAKPRSRYAEAAQVLTPEDKAAIQKMVSNVALVEKVTEVSAF